MGRHDDLPLKSLSWDSEFDLPSLDHFTSKDDSFPELSYYKLQQMVPLHRALDIVVSPKVGRVLSQKAEAWLFKTKPHLRAASKDYKESQLGMLRLNYGPMVSPLVPDNKVYLRGNP